MTNRHTLFTQVQQYYADLCARLASAQEKVSMTFLSFDDGVWARRLARALSERAAAGVRVRLLVDGFGEMADEPRHILSNRALIHDLRAAGIRVDIFNPAAPGLTLVNRMHCKIAAIDDATVYLGGSNIGDYYTAWSDSNLRVDGRLGNSFHDLYDYLLGFASRDRSGPRLDPSDLWAGTDRAWLTVPSQHLDIRSALLKLIREADRSVYIRTWYFLPDSEILDALCEQAGQGVRVNVLLSHKTRVRPIDFANHIHIHRLVSAGGCVYRYTPRYMHAKVGWNNHGEVLFGSANLDSHSMRNNFESCLQIHDPALAAQLHAAFEADLSHSLAQTPDSHPRRSFPEKMLSYACNVAAPWL
jgi:cardiolipin synthase